MKIFLGCKEIPVAIAANVGENGKEFYLLLSLNQHKNTSEVFSPEVFMMDKFLLSPVE
ncbi:MAG: hypothetical protein MUC87_21500 [Bacteroidia bacterium]|jgi:hypothetical protein|nr:hypothetical protein [Bacteroidia bacterium]